MSAWAIVVDGEIDIRTVAPTDIGAMVNWLVVSAGAIIQQGVTDENVRLWFGHCPVEVRRVLQ